MLDREDEIENDDLETDEDEEEDEKEEKGAGKSFSKLDGMTLNFFFIEVKYENDFLLKFSGFNYC